MQIISHHVVRDILIIIPGGGARHSHHHPRGWCATFSSSSFPWGRCATQVRDDPNLGFGIGPPSRDVAQHHMAYAGGMILHLQPRIFCSQDFAKISSTSHTHERGYTIELGAPPSLRLHKSIISVYRVDYYCREHGANNFCPPVCITSQMAHTAPAPRNIT